MHKESGEVASESDWRADYESMDIESWHGCESKDANPNNWLEEGHLIEVEKNESGEWEEV